MEQMNQILYETIIRQTEEDLIPWNWVVIGWSAEKGELNLSILQNLLALIIGDEITSFPMPDERLVYLLTTRYSEIEGGQPIKQKALKMLNSMEVQKDCDSIAKKLLDDET